MQICHLFLQHSESFDVSHVFLPLTIAELSTLKQVRFFWPTLYNNNIANYNAHNVDNNGSITGRSVAQNDWTGSVVGGYPVLFYIIRQTSKLSHSSCATMTALLHQKQNHSHSACVSTYYYKLH